MGVNKRKTHEEQAALKSRFNQELNTMKESYDQRIQKIERENNSLKNILSKVFVWFPVAKELLNTEKLCRTIGLTAEQIATVFRGAVLSFTGWLHSEEHKQKFKTEDSKIHLYISEEKKQVGLVVDGKMIADWFKEKFELLKQSSQVKQEVKRNRGVRM